MANSNAKPKFCLRLLIDDEKNRVVLAEAGKDFVDVLCSLLSLPMGTIVRLLEKHQNQQSSIVGCFHNLYKSVSDMDLEDFETQACKNLLLYPRNAKVSHCKKLKLNIDDTEATKFFVCPQYICNEGCCKVFSNFSTTKCCNCGRVMTHPTQVAGDLSDGSLGDKADGLFLSRRTSFIITDDLKVAVNSMGVVLNFLDDLGYDGFDKLQEMLIDVGFEEVLTLLGCLFTSETPLTDTFLRKKCITRKRKMSTPLVQETSAARDSEKLLTLKVYVRKTDNVILYAECEEDFVDFLFTFLAIPLQFAWELSVDNGSMGCIGNLCRSLKVLSFEEPLNSHVYKCKLPYHYNIRVQLLDVDLEEVQEYECLVERGYRCSSLSRKIQKTVLAQGERIAKLTASDSTSMGFVKGETNFIVSDDLVVTPMNSSSTISLLRKLEMSFSDIEEQVISFGKSEATSLLRASLITSSALTNGLSNFLSKMKTTPSPSKSQKYNAVAVPTEYNFPQAEKVDIYSKDPSKVAVSVVPVSADGGGCVAKVGAAAKIEKKKEDSDDEDSDDEDSYNEDSDDED